MSRTIESPIEGICARSSSPNPAGTLIKKFLDDSQMQQHFKLKSNLLYFKDRLFIHRETGLTSTLLHEFLSTPLGGHSGIHPTLARLRTSFYWPGMHKDVKQFVNQSTTCQCNKYNTHSPYDLLQPLPLPAQVYSSLGRYLHGFHHPPSQFQQQNNHMGRGRPINHIPPAHQFHSCIGCSNHHFRDIPSPWCSQNHCQWQRSYLCEPILAFPVQILGNYSRLQQLIPPLDKRSNRGPKSLAQDISPMFYQWRAQALVPFSSSGRVLVQHHLPLFNWNVTFRSSI